MPRKVPPLTGRVKKEISVGPYQTTLPAKSVAIDGACRMLCRRIPSLEGIDEVSGTTDGAFTGILPVLKGIGALAVSPPVVVMVCQAMYWELARTPAM